MQLFLRLEKNRKMQEEMIITSHMLKHFLNLKTMEQNNFCRRLQPDMTGHRL